jgi:large subunit ribosomal protein L10
MQGIALTAIIFAAFSAYAETADSVGNSLAEMLLARAPANVLRARPSCSRLTDPAMVKECRFGIKVVRKPRAEKLAVYDVMVKGARQQLDKADVIFTVPGDGLTVPQKDEMKFQLPKDVFQSVVKNSLMKNILKEYPKFAAARSLCNGANMWFFLKYDDVRETMDVMKEWRTKSGVDPEKYVILGGATDGKLLNTKEVNDLSKLPTKQELMGKVASMINSIPTKIAKGINEVPSKLARGVNAASAKRLTRAIELMKEKMD